MESPEMRWQPLEANPEVINRYLLSLGLCGSWEFVDVFSLELLDMIPKPCCAFVFLFPITKNYENHCEEEKKRIDDQPQKLSPAAYFMKQTIGNACGTIGLIHAVANNQQKHQLVTAESILGSFLSETKDMTPEDRGKNLESNEKICKAHQSSAQEGQSREIGADERVDLHFVAIVNVDGKIYEFDGRKPYPIVHGPCPDDDNFLVEGAKVCQKFMDRDPQEHRFSIVALSRTGSA